MSATKTTHRTHSPFRTSRDRKGRLIVTVEAGKGRTFEVHADDWRTIRREYGPTWFLLSDGKGHEYVAGYRQGLDSPLLLARAIVQAGPGEVVKYRDRNPMNLRRENLKVIRGAARHAAQPRDLSL